MVEDMDGCPQRQKWTKGDWKFHPFAGDQHDGHSDQGAGKRRNVDGDDDALPSKQGSDQRQKFNITSTHTFPTGCKGVKISDGVKNSTAKQKS